LFLAATVSSAAATTASTTSTADQVAVDRLKHEISMFEFQRKLEVDKLEVERLKAWITGISYMVPLMVAALSFLMSVRSQAEQSRLQRESQEKTALAQFELKAAEIVLAEKGPVGLLNKARALKALFPHRLPEDFVSKFNPADYEGGSKGEGGVEAKLKFFEIASKMPGKEKELSELWRTLFSGDTWTDRVKKSDGSVEA
jgi:hypothetical protein